MNYTFVEFFSYSVGIAALLGLKRFAKLDRAFFPFIILLWLGLINELLTTFIIKMAGSNAVNNNIFVLLESILITWFFYRVDLFAGQKELFSKVLAFFILVWVIENIFLSTITQFNSYFRIVYSFSVVFMSIHMLNRQFITNTGNLQKNAIFLICMGFIIFFTYKALVEIFWVYGLNASRGFRIQIYRIMSFVDLTVNLIYAIAVIWMPTKRKFTLL